MKLFLLVFVAVVPWAFGDQQPCSLSLHELLTGHTGSQEEFIEVKKSCEQNYDISSYVLILWEGALKKNTSATVSHIGNFSYAGLSSMNRTFLFIGSNKTYTLDTLPSTTNFLPFENFGNENWKKGLNFWMPTGNKRTIAMVLYQNLTGSDFRINMTLTNITAHRENIVDLIFYYHPPGSAHGIKDYLFPDYRVGKPGTEDNDYFRLPTEVKAERSNRKKENSTLSSFGFCCNEAEISSMWPLAFKRTTPTPGAPNICENATYVLDPKGSYFIPGQVDRCNVTQVENFHATTVAPPTTTPVHSSPSPFPGTSTAQPAPASKSNVIGLAVGIPVLLIVLGGALFGFLFYRRRYRSLSTDRNCFSLHWWRSDPEANRLVIDT